jgi:hypothetical protein
MGFTRPGSEIILSEAVADTQETAQYRVTIEESGGGYLPIILTTTPIQHRATPSTAATQQESKTSRREYAKRAVCLEGIMRQHRAVRERLRRGPW